MHGRDWTALRGLLTFAAIAVLALPAAAIARPAKAAKDGRPNILVVMTDDQAASRRGARCRTSSACSPQRGTTFADAVDSFPLCCPARATFITGQYAHNHGVGGQLLALRLVRDEGPRATPCRPGCRRSGYRTALIGKWLNGYGARDAPRRGAGRLRHLARAARCLGLRLLQLRDEQRRRPQDLGGRRLRPQARRVREDRGDPRTRRARGRARRADATSSGPPPTTTGARRARRTTRPT